MEKLDSPPLPVDLAAHPSFVTQGFIVAREKYKNLNDHSTYRFLPSQSGASLVMEFVKFRALRCRLLNSASSLIDSRFGSECDYPETQGAFDVERSFPFDFRGTRSSPWEQVRLSS